MWERVRNLLAPVESTHTTPTPGYEPIGDENGEVRSHASAVKDDAGIYWSFWFLGAGVLLSWNGECSPASLRNNAILMAVLICTFPLLASFFPEESGMRASLASWLSTVFCFANFIFLGIAQKQVGKISPSPRLHSSLVLLFITSILFTFLVLPLLLPALAPGFLVIPLLVIFTLLLAVGTSYLQSAVFALAALWGSTEMVGVMSGQGGIAVLVSAVQVILAALSALRTSDDDSESGDQSTAAGVGLWFVCTFCVLGCMLAHRHLMRHPEYTAALAPILHRQEEAVDHGMISDKGLETTRRVFKKNLKVNVAVAWTFGATLVSHSRPKGVDRI